MSTLTVALYIIWLQPLVSINYIDHVSAITSNFEVHSDDVIYSMDNNTKMHMQGTGNFVLSHRANSSSTWIIQWQTGFNNNGSIKSRPIFAVQVDGNIVVYKGENCTDCAIWSSNTARACCGIYHFFVHNNGYAYLLDANHNVAGFTTDPSITPFSDQSLYPSGTLTPNPTSQPTQNQS